MIMVRTAQEDLLAHPLVGSLLRHKWRSFGRYFYYTNLFIYCIFLTFLTGYICTTDAPYQLEHEYNMWVYEIVYSYTIWKHYLYLKHWWWYYNKKCLACALERVGINVHASDPMMTISVKQYRMLPVTVLNSHYLPSLVNTSSWGWQDSTYCVRWVLKTDTCKLMYQRLDKWKRRNRTNSVL